MPHSLAYLLQQGLNALSLFAFYAPLSLAFALLQAISGRVFLSFGDVAMFGSFAAVYACFGLLLHGFADWQSAALSLMMAVACTASLGLVAGRQIFQKLQAKSGLAFMIASLGFSLILQEGMRVATSSGDVWVPPLFDGEGLLLMSGGFPVRITVNALFAIAMAALCVSLAFALIRFTRFGREWRAAAESAKLASLCGINVAQVFVLTFALSSALAAVSGWMAGVSYGGTNFAAGMMLGFKAMFASLAGGFGSLAGAIGGALILALLEVAFGSILSGGWRDVGVFAAIILILLLRPEAQYAIGDDKP